MLASRGNPSPPCAFTPPWGMGWVGAFLNSRLASELPKSLGRRLPLCIPTLERLLWASWRESRRLLRSNPAKLVRFVDNG